MLHNRVYLGELRDGEYVNPTAHPAIIDPETFEAVQAGTSRPPRSMSGPALLAGLIRCAGCGHIMSRTSAAAVVYNCARRHSGGSCPEPASVTAALIDRHVERIALAELERLAVTVAEGDNVKRAAKRVADAEAELRNYLRMVNLAGIDVATAAEAARQRKQAVEAAKDELRAEHSRSQHLPIGGTGADVWQPLRPAEKNALLRSLLAAVLVRRAGGRGARVPLEERVHVLAYGADVRLPHRRGGRAIGIVPIALPDLDAPGVLRVPSGEDRP